MYSNVSYLCLSFLSISLSISIAARMETTGVKDKIHVSKFSADLLIAAGKEKWILPREEMVEAKRKGMMNTFFLTKGISKLSSSETMSNSGSNYASEIESVKPDVEVQSADLVRRERLVDWMSGKVTTNYIQKHIRSEY